MKLLSGLLTLIIFATTLGIADNIMIPFQGTVCPESTSGLYSSVFQLISSTGNVLWSETKMVTVDSGEIAIFLGDTNSVPSSLPVEGLVLKATVETFSTYEINVRPVLTAIKAQEAEKVSNMVTTVNAMYPSNNVVSEKAVVNYINSLPSNNNSNTPILILGEGEPKFPPKRLGDIYVRTDSHHAAYIGIDTTSTSGWKSL